MGVYNTVVAQCPHCGGEVAWQSKADDGFRQYGLADTPKRTAEDLDGKMAHCSGCGAAQSLRLVYVPRLVLA
jgi:hypothetical protein